MKSSAESTAPAAETPATLTLNYGQNCRRTMEGVIDECKTCCRDDITSQVDDLPSTDAMEQMRDRRDDLHRYTVLRNSLTDERAEIPADLLDELTLICGYRAEELADKLNKLPGMSWDDCQHFDSELLASEIYDVHELLTGLKRLQFEIERGIGTAA